MKQQKISELYFAATCAQSFAMPQETNDDGSAFPIESIFPGIHKARPDIAEQEAWAFLQHGHKTGGIDLADEKTRTDILARDIAFFIHPLPADIAEKVKLLPDDWQEKPDTYPLAEEINTAIERHYNLPANRYVSINEKKEAWVCPQS